MRTLNRMAKNSSIAAAAAPELVEAVEIQHGRPEDDDDRHEDEVARQRGHALGDGQRLDTRSAVEAEEVGEDPGQRWTRRPPATKYADHDPRLELHHVGEVGEPVRQEPPPTKARKRASNTWRL